MKDKKIIKTSVKVIFIFFGIWLFGSVIWPGFKKKEEITIVVPASTRGKYESLSKSYESVRGGKVNIITAEELFPALAKKGDKNHAPSQQQQNNQTDKDAGGSVGISRKKISELALALEKEIRNHGEQYPKVARKQLELGEALISIGEYEEAISYLKPAHKYFEKSFGKNDPHTKTARKRIAHAILRMKNSKLKTMK